MVGRHTPFLIPCVYISILWIVTCFTVAARGADFGSFLFPFPAKKQINGDRVPYLITESKNV